MPRKTIMVVEDESLVALDIQESLLELGYEVPQPISSGETAIFQVSELDPDLVIMDIKLKGEISGIEAAHEIYQKYQIPIIFLTAYGDQDTLAKAREAHPFGYILKPFTDRQLETTVQMALHRHDVEDQLKEHQRRLKRSQHIAHLGDWEWDRESGRVNLSEELAEMLGFQRHDLVHDENELIDLVHPGDIKRIQKSVQRVLEDFSQKQKEVFRIQRPDGSVRWLEASPPSVERMSPTGEPLALVGTLYDVTDRMDYEEDRRQRDRYLSAVNKITRAALEGSTIQEIQHILTESLGELFHAKACYLTSWDDRDNKTVPVSAYGAEADSAAFLALNFEGNERSITKEVLQRVEPLLVDNIKRTPYLPPRKRRTLPAGKYLAIPLVSGQKKLGAVILVFSQKREVTQGIIDQAQEISGQVALAIAKTELLRETKGKWKETEILRIAGMELINTHKLEDTLGVFLDYLERLADFHSATVFLIRGDEYFVADSIGLPETEDVKGRYFSKDAYLLQDIMHTKKSVVKENVQEDQGFAGWGGTGTTRGWMGVPLISKGEVIGVLTLDHHRSGAYQESKIGAIEVLANQAATAIQKVRLAKAEKDQLYITRTLQEISSLLASGVELEDVLSSILQLLKRVVEYDQAYIAFVENETELRLAAGRGPTNQGAIQEFYDQHAGTIIDEFTGKAKEPIVHPDVREVGGWLSFKEGIDVRSTINAPLLFRGELVGILFVDSTRSNAYTEEMGRTVMAFANQAALAINNARLFERNQQLAMTDDLTGVYNRRFLMDFGEKEVKRARRYQDPLSMLMFDLDGFKEINDTFGHAVGDTILREAAQRCGEAIREIDIIARYGGDEFVVILVKAGIDAAEKVAGRLKEVVESVPIDTDKGSMKVTLSVGIAELKEHHRSLDDLLIQVDEALYSAKDAGRDCIKAAQ